MVILVWLLLLLCHSKADVKAVVSVTLSSNTVDYSISLPSEELSLDSITKTVLDITLQRCSGNKSEAAKMLKVNRKMFYR